MREGGSARERSVPWRGAGRGCWGPCSTLPRDASPGSGWAGGEGSPSRRRRLHPRGKALV